MRSARRSARAQVSGGLIALITLGATIICIALMGCEDAQPSGDLEPTVRVDLCERVTCSQRGVCVVLDGAPTCACDEGYRADPVNGLACLPLSEGRPQETPRDMEPAPDQDLSFEDEPDVGAPRDMGGEIEGDRGPADLEVEDVLDMELDQEMTAGEMTAGEMTAGEMTAGESAGITAGEDDTCPSAPDLGCVELEGSDESVASGSGDTGSDLCDGLDNDCDGRVDEGCQCKAGEVKSCFSGPPGLLGSGACAEGTMRCVQGERFGEWGECEGEVTPEEERCDGLDNDCDTCVDEIDSCEPEITCPAPGDPRVPDALPFNPYVLDGALFYQADPDEEVTWSWSIIGGPCDAFSLNQRSFTLIGADQERATFTPTLSGSYQVTLTVTSSSGERFECSWVIHARAPGLRVEMCYPESTYLDLDLFLMRHSQSAPWFFDVFDPFTPSPLACSWANCEAQIRGIGYPRVSWGYAASPIAACVNTPQGQIWSALVGECSNPRLDIDNNLSEGIGVPENINIDQPLNNETYRVMVHNFSGDLAHPIVNVYCGGALKATVGAAPDRVEGFQGPSLFSVGAMWRALDVTTLVDELGETYDCVVDPLTPPGLETGFDVTINDTRF